MRCLVIAPQPFFSARGTPFSVYYRTLVMAEQGVSVDLLTYGEGDDIEIPNVRIVRIPRVPGCRKIKIGPSPQKAVLDVFMLLWTVGLLLRRRYHAVHAHEEAAFWAAFLKPVFRYKLIYDMHSSLPQQLTNFEFTTSKLIIGAFEALERASLKASDAVITICPELETQALGLGADPAKHRLIENSIFEPVRMKRTARPAPADAAGGEPAARPSVLDDIPRDAPIVGYTGTFEVYQGLDVLLGAAKRVKDRGLAANFLVVGGTADQVAALRAEAERLGVADRCFIRERVGKDEAIVCVAAADVLVSPRLVGNNTPLKVYEQLASNTPLVATRILSHTQVLDDEVCFMAEPEAGSFADAIARALTDAPEAQRRAANARRLFDEKYSRPAYERKMREILAMVGHPGEPSPAAQPA